MLSKANIHSVNMAVTLYRLQQIQLNRTKKQQLCTGDAAISVWYCSTHTQ